MKCSRPSTFLLYQHKHQPHRPTAISRSLNRTNPHPIINLSQNLLPSASTLALTLPPSTLGSTQFALSLLSLSPSNHRIAASCTDSASASAAVGSAAVNPVLLRPGPLRLRVRDWERPGCMMHSREGLRARAQRLHGLFWWELLVCEGLLLVKEQGRERTEHGRQGWRLMWWGVHGVS